MLFMSPIKFLNLVESTPRCNKAVLEACGGPNLHLTTLYFGFSFNLSPVCILSVLGSAFYKRLPIQFCSVCYFILWPITNINYVPKFSSSEQNAFLSTRGQKGKEVYKG